MATIPSTIGRYQIVELVGRGGMGVLYRARDPVLERDVALKMMHVDFTLDNTARDRFQREAKAVARLQHRNVVTIHELGEVDGTPYIVMEFLSGKDLDTWLKGALELSLLQKIEIAAQLCDGLAYAHDQGIIHRDIKPGNVRVLEDGTVKILDFGIAKFAMSSVTQSGTVMGTPSYMAPEQIMGLPLDGRADLFSVGVLLYELFSGQKPFSGDTPTAVVYQIMHVEPPQIRSVVPDIPDPIHEIVTRALQKDPNERYSKAAEMAADLNMVKMMLDLPLGSNERTQTGPISGSAATLQLHATTMRPKTGGTPSGVLNTRIRPSAVAATADAAPRARTEEPSRSGVIWMGAAAAVVVIGGLGYFLMGGRSGETPPQATKNAQTTGGPTNGTAAPEPADFKITSVPAGARISIDGTDTGQVTPASLPRTQLTGAIELNLAGFKPATATLTEADLKTGAREIRLAREAVAVRLTVSGTYPFEIVQGSKVVSAADIRHEVTLQPGGGAVMARNRELFLSQALGVDYQRAQVTATVPALGTLAVYGNETCSVVVDGQDLGFPPIQPRRAAAGGHTVTLRCPDGKEDSQRVTITSGAPSRVTFGRD